MGMGKRPFPTWVGREQEVKNALILYFKHPLNENAVSRLASDSYRQPYFPIWTTKFP